MVSSQFPKAFSGDASQSWVEAVSIRGDRILAIGTNDVIRASAGPQTRMIDLHGRMAMPGINDSHDHAGGELDAWRLVLPWRVASVEAP